MSAQPETHTLEYAPAFAELLQHRHPLAAARTAVSAAGKLSSVAAELWQQLGDDGWLQLWQPEHREAVAPEILAFAEAAGRQSLALPYGFATFVLPALRTMPELAAFAWQLPEGSVTVGRVHASADTAPILIDFLGSDAAYFDLALSPGTCQLRRMALTHADTVAGLDPCIPVAAVAPANAQVLAQARFAMGRERMLGLLQPYLVFEYGQMVGAALAALDLAISYAKERRQFGRAIGEFQAIKHQLADAWVGVDNARYALRALQAAAADDAALPALLRQCDRIVSTSCQRATRLAVQVHGGIGFAWEHDAHLHLKRSYKLAAQLRPLVQALA